MNVYIYGNQSFKKEIHETLEHANIKFKLDANTKIEEIDSLDILKKRIIENPSDIYLIDEAKIIKKNMLNQKIKFLTPKDAIEEEFLFENGVADLSVNSLAEIPKYILKKYESIKENSNEIEESIIDIVDEAYNENNDNIENNEKISYEDNYDKIELDEELELLLSSSSSEDNLLSQSTDFAENVGLSNVSSDYDDNDNIDDLLISNDESELIDEELDLNEDETSDKIENDIEIINEEIIENELDLSEDPLLSNIEGESMIENEFSQLDSLNEKDILDALSNMDTIEIKENPKKENIQKDTNINVESSNVNDIAELISKLLNNKTLEITIKIKD